MSGLGYVFIGAGLLFALRPSAATRYPDGSVSGERFVRFVAGPGLIVLEVLIAPRITIRYRFNSIYDTTLETVDSA
jgi:hypothetical protein